MTSAQVDTTSASTTPNPPYAILRIKRKRNEEPLDALVVETVRRKKSRGLGVFQYAETVEDSAWDDAEEKRDIQEKISQLQETQQEPVVKREEKVRRYKVIDRDQSSSQIPSFKGLQSKSTKNFKLYDAVPTEQPPVSQDETSSDVDRFLPLLNDYLKIHDINPSDDTVAPLSTSSNQPNDDYVWDIFYHRPATLSEWNSMAANVGTITGLSELESYDSASDSDQDHADEADEDSNAEDFYKNDYPDSEEDSDGSSEDQQYRDSDDDFE